MIKTVGSVCSGIEAASVAWEPFDVKFEWFSEIAPFPSRVLAERYPSVPNLGDMEQLPELITREKITAPDLICGGTPCQAFSLAGWKNGLNDDRGNLTLKFVDIIEANDKRRLNVGQNRCTVFWENVEGVLTDKTNAFGCLISSLAGLDDVLTVKNARWPTAGVLYGKKRNVAWRVLDAKYFGVPQQRRRLYLVAGGKEFAPESVLFEVHTHEFETYPSSPLTFEKDGHYFEVFREYTDCLYASYGTKWNGNAAAYNGSLFVVQDGRIRRLSPLETERLMGFPDNYTEIPNAKKTTRYQSTGNSWAVPVIRWVGQRLFQAGDAGIDLKPDLLSLCNAVVKISDTEYFYNLEQKGAIEIPNGEQLNCTSIPEKCVFAKMQDVVSADAPEDIYISPVGCFGIIRRKRERRLRILPRLEEVLLSISAQMSLEEIEKKSRVQKRGKFSTTEVVETENFSEGYTKLTAKKSRRQTERKHCSANKQLSLLD